jgi:beta-lactam-binding protein with PASTA domain
MSKGLSLPVTLLAGVALALTGCGSEERAVAMPQVVGKRLDVAKSDLKAAGLEEKKIEIVGGGALGVISESSWTVCDQDPEPATKGAEQARLIVDRACGAEDTAQGISPTASSPSAASPTVTSTATGEVGEAATVPNVVGMDLQAAQDLMQAQGFYSLISHDATGQDRYQILDRSWKVCDQQPAAGTQTSKGTTTDMGAVRDEEACR